jgi:hypothetical protein
MMTRRKRKRIGEILKLVNSLLVRIERTRRIIRIIRIMKKEKEMKIKKETFFLEELNIKKK